MSRILVLFLILSLSLPAPGPTRPMAGAGNSASALRPAGLEESKEKIKREFLTALGAFPSSERHEASGLEERQEPESTLRRKVVLGGLAGAAAVGIPGAFIESNRFGISFEEELQTKPIAPEELLTPSQMEEAGTLGYFSSLLPKGTTPAAILFETSPTDPSQSVSVDHKDGSVRVEKILGASGKEEEAAVRVSLVGTVPEPIPCDLVVLWVETVNLASVQASLTPEGYQARPLSIGEAWLSRGETGAVRPVFIRISRLPTDGLSPYGRFQLKINAAVLYPMQRAVFTIHRADAYQTAEYAKALREYHWRSSSALRGLEDGAALGLTLGSLATNWYTRRRRELDDQRTRALRAARVVAENQYVVSQMGSILLLAQRFLDHSLLVALQEREKMPEPFAVQEFQGKVQGLLEQFDQSQKTMSDRAHFARGLEGALKVASQDSLLDDSQKLRNQLRNGRLMLTSQLVAEALAIPYAILLGRDLLKEACDVMIPRLTFAGLEEEWKPMEEVVEVQPPAVVTQETVRPLVFQIVKNVEWALRQPATSPFQIEMILPKDPDGWPKLPATVGGYSGELDLYHVVENAVDAIALRSKNEESSYKGRLKVTLRQDGTALILEIEDNGTGIKRDVLNQWMKAPTVDKKKGEQAGGQGKAIFLGAYHTILAVDQKGSLFIETRHPETGAWKLSYDPSQFDNRKRIAISEGDRQEIGTTVRWRFDGVFSTGLEEGLTWDDLIKIAQELFPHLTVGQDLTKPGKEISADGSRIISNKDGTPTEVLIKILETYTMPEEFQDFLETLTQPQRPLSLDDLIAVAKVFYEKKGDSVISYDLSAPGNEIRVEGQRVFAHRMASPQEILGAILFSNQAAFPQLAYDFYEILNRVKGYPATRNFRRIQPGEEIKEASDRVLKALLEAVSPLSKPEALIVIGPDAARDYASELYILSTYMAASDRKKLFVLTETEDQAESLKRNGLIATFLGSRMLAGEIKWYVDKDERLRSLGEPLRVDFYDGSTDTKRLELQGELGRMGIRVTLVRHAPAHVEVFLKEILASLMKVGLEEVDKFVNVKQLAIDVAVLTKA